MDTLRMESDVLFYSYNTYFSPSPCVPSFLDYCQTQNKGRTLDSGWTVVKTSCMTFQLTSGMAYLTKLPKWMFWKNVYPQKTLTDCSLPWSEVEEIIQCSNMPRMSGHSSSEPRSWRPL